MRGHSLKRKFDGKIYDYNHSYSNKKIANKVANRGRRRGYNMRIVKLKSLNNIKKTEYAVYSKNSKKFEKYINK